VNPPRQLEAGTVFGLLMVTGATTRDARRRLLWVCRCECGSHTAASSSDLRSGRVVSCGCKRLSMLRTSNLRHGGTHTRTFSIWKDMHRRCFNRNCAAFPNYGGRGITICDRWREFPAFLADMGPCPSGLSIERIDVNGNYEPQNCRWASRHTQARNTRRTVLVEYRGERMALIDACSLAGLPYATVRDRIRLLKWPVEQALSVPVGDRRG